MHAFLFNSQQHRLKVGVSKTIIFSSKYYFHTFIRMQLIDQKWL